jgi:peptidoglycan/LPS O-acetylase OafA/YrhL
MAAGSALLMALLFQPLRDPSRVFYGTDTRAQSLLVGALLAMLLLERKPVSNVFGKAALQGGAVVCALFLGLVWARAGDDSSLLYRGGFLVLGVAVATDRRLQPGMGVVGMFAATLRWLGLISYSVYPGTGRST